MDSDRDWRDWCTIVQEKHSHLLKSGKFSDVVFLVGENKVPIHAHKFILMVASPVFEIQFCERWNKETDIEIPDVTPKAFEVFLTFLYTDEFTVTEEEAEDVLGLAHKYMVKSLSKECSKLLESTMKVSNVVNIHRFATTFGTVVESLQQKALEFILKNGSAVIEDIGFLEVDLEMLSIILKHDKLCSDEVTVFEGVMRWVENRCKVEKLEPTVENKRIVLNDMIHLIRFTLMGSQDFTNVVMIEYGGILTQAESVGIFMHFNAAPHLRSHLPSIPFNMEKRCGGFLYFVRVHDRENRVLLSQLCRQSFGSNASSHCEKTFQLRSSHNICVKAIELWPHYNYSDGVHYLTFDDSKPVTEAVNSGIFASVSLMTKTGSTLVGTFLPTISPKIKFHNGVQIERNKYYKIKLVINNIRAAESSYMSSGSGVKLARSGNVICRQDNVEFTFATVSNECCHQQQPTYRTEQILCICHGQIRSIHFTI